MQTAVDLRPDLRMVTAVLSGSFVAGPMNASFPNPPRFGSLKDYAVFVHRIHFGVSFNIAKYLTTAGVLNGFTINYTSPDANADALKTIWYPATSATQNGAVVGSIAAETTILTTIDIDCSAAPFKLGRTTGASYNIALNSVFTAGTGGIVAGTDGFNAILDSTGGFVVYSYAKQVT